MKCVFARILSTESDDALVYDLSSLEVTDITEFKEYHGIHVSVMSYLDRTRVPIAIDIGFGDIIYPSRIKIEFPVLLDMEIPEIYIRDGSVQPGVFWSMRIVFRLSALKHKDFDLYFCGICGKLYLKVTAKWR